MAFKEGFNFRATLAYVTDPADTQFVDNTAEYQYPKTNAGVTFGWDADPGARNRNSGIDARLAGGHYQANNGTQRTFRVDLDATGSHDITLAAGDYAYSRSDMYIRFKDNTSVIDTIDDVGNTIESTHFLDATGVERTSAADWVSNNVTINHTFTSTAFFVIIGQPASETSESWMSHLSIEEVGAAGTTITPVAASLSIAGQAVSVLLPFISSPGAGSLAMAGQAVDMNFGTLISPSLGLMSIDGQAVTVAVLTSISPATGTISIAGQDVDIATLRIISPSSATLSIDGQSVTVDAVFVQVKETGFIFKLVGKLVPDLIKELIS